MTLPPDVKIVIASAVGDDMASRLESEEKFLRGLSVDSRVAGAIVWYVGRDINEPALQAVRASGIPMVFLDRLPPSSIQADFVGSDNAGSARRAVQHLISLGHRRIGILSNIDKVSSVLAREAGYRKALRDNGVEPCAEYSFEVQTDEIESVYDALKKMLSLAEPPTAIFGINDHIALQAHTALTSLGVSIPDQMSVLGFDGLLRWVPGGGYLTSAWQEFEYIGQTAAELVLERMESPQDQNFRHILFDAPVRARASTACALTDQPIVSLEQHSSTEEILS